MSILRRINNEYVVKIWIDKDNLYAESDSGKVAFYKLSKFKGFNKASQDQLKNFKVLGGKDIYQSSRR